VRPNGAEAVVGFIEVAWFECALGHCLLFNLRLKLHLFVTLSLHPLVGTFDHIFVCGIQIEVTPVLGDLVVAAFDFVQFVCIIEFLHAGLPAVATLVSAFGKTVHLLVHRQQNSLLDIG